MSHDRVKIFSICADARNILKEFILENDEYDFCYFDLRGACASASMMLYNIFTSMCIGCTFVEKETPYGSHCWVELSNGLVVDITASQFGGENIYIARRAPTTHLGKGKHHRYRCINIEDLYDALIDIGWDSDALIPPSVVQELSECCLRANM